jgi:tetratricopeptide (TPR) repeat protein
LAAAAVILLSLFAGVRWVWLQRQPPLDLLAKAYTKRRTFDLRIPGATFGPLRVERGSVTGADRPAELSESEAMIRRHLDSRTPDAEWLHAKGRADLLEGRFDDAIQTLRLSLDREASANERSSAETLVDLATAYHERAVTADRPIDDSMATDLLGRALQADPSFSVALFNRAIVFERMKLYQNAMSDWNRYLGLDSSGKWADEARKRLKGLESKLNGAALKREGRLEDLPEYQLEEAMKSEFAASISEKLSGRLRQDHQDFWLSDVLSNGAPESTELLASMVVSRQKMAVDRFPAELDQLNSLAGRTLALPFRIWLECERLFRIARSPHVANCIGGLDGLVDICRSRHYPWFLTQFLLERSNCEMARGDLAHAEASAREAVDISTKHEFPVARLRAFGYLSNRLVSAGRYREAAEIQRSSLDLFWSRPFPYLRAQQVYSDMLRLDEALSRWHAAKAAAEISAWMANASDAKITEAVTHAIWADLADRIGAHAEASVHYARAKAMFDALERNPFSDQYRAFAEANTAEAHQDRAALLGFESVVHRSTNPMVVVPFLRTLARFDERDGHLVLAKQRLEEAVHHINISDRPAPPIAEASGWRAQMQGAYRELVGVDLHLNDVRGAFTQWQDLQRADGALEGFRSNTPLIEAEGSMATFVTFARLRDHYGAWVQSGDSLEFSWIPTSADQIDRLVRQYSSLCATKESRYQDLHQLGNRLRSELLDPAIRRTPKDGVILLQPDADLSRLPWQCLPLPSGEPLNAEFLLATAPLAMPYPASYHIAPLTIRSGLIIGASLVSPSRVSDYPPLPDLTQELAAVGAALTDSRLLQAEEATVSNIASCLRHADAVHFAGHAIVAPSGIRLLVSPDPHARDAEASQGLWSPDVASGTHLRLAVLSACSTARYEEVESPEPPHLASTLLLGGAREVLAAQWNADSAATSRFMQTFYRGLQEGRTTLAAVREASRDVRRQPDWNGPYFWACFSLFVRP